jgi:DNA-binding transcriptional LysR family regulator
MDKFGEVTVFLQVVEAGSFSAAGRRLGLSPSAVSKLVSRLEERLQVRLFERVAGAIRLTQEGQAFRAASQRVVDTMQEAEDAVTAIHGEISGLVRIHTALTTAKYLITPHLPELMERHPKLRLEFVLGTERADFVRQGLDVAVHSGRPTELSLIGRPLMRRPWSIAAAPQYLARHGTPLRPDDLLKHRCLNFTIRTLWNSWVFNEDDAIKFIDIPGSIGADQGELLRTLALVGLGVVRLANFHIAEDLKRGTLVPLLAEFHEQTDDDRFYLLYPQGRVQAPRVKAVVDFLSRRLR